MGTTDPDVSKARQNLYRNIEDAETLGKIHEGIEGQREHFDNLGLHIGYIYGDRQIPGHASVYEPVCTPGARLPHTWIKILSPELDQLPAIDSSYVSEFSPDEVQTKRFSTLDLCPFNAFILIADSTSASHWGRCLREMQEQLPAAASSLKIRLFIEGQDFETQSDVHGQNWIEIMGLRTGQATLVRPDQHILACFGRGSGSFDIARVLKEHLAW